ncbi:MAG: GNAT family N-acetyltransferase [Pyrinomonadaceae bacterium]
MSSATQTTSIVFRDLEAIDEIKALENLQIETWGDDERDIVPLNQFVAARHVGGSLIGAFDGEKLVGFVYGFYGHIGGRIVHHSHMLAVSPSYRRHNLGFRLKAEQRERVLADRLTDRMTWTFDPLQSLNAHFNFTKLGVVSDMYKINVYGEEGASFLHRNGTDRLFVTWLLNSPRVQKSMAEQQGPKHDLADSRRSVSRLLRHSKSGYPEPAANIAAALNRSRFAEIEIPADINGVESADFNLARKWREETRSVFSQALSEGYVVVDYALENELSGIYILEKAQLDRLES